MKHSDVIIGHVITSSVKLHQEAPEREEREGKGMINCFVF